MGSIRFAPTGLLAVLCLLGLLFGPAQAAERSCPAATGKTFSGDYTDQNFSSMPAGSLIGANFQNAVLKGAIFIGQDLSGASFYNAKLGPSSKGSADFTNATLTGTCFIKATLDATDFSFAKMTCTDFSSTSLLKANFGPLQSISSGANCRTRFNASMIDIHAIALANWGLVDFTDTIFTGLLPGTFSLAGQDITGAMLGCTTFTRPPAPGCKGFSGLDLTSANLTGVDLTGAVLAKAKLDNSELNGVQLAHADLTYATLTCARLYGSAPNPRCTHAPPVSSRPPTAANLAQADLRYANLTDATLDYAMMGSVSLSGAVLTRASLQKASLEALSGAPNTSVLGADFTGANFSDAQIDNVSFQNVILTEGVFAGKSTLNGTSFAGTIMPGATFTGATLQGVNFSNAVLENASFAGAKLLSMPGQTGSTVGLSCAQLGGADFSNATVTAANFQSAVMPPAPLGMTPPQPCCKQVQGPAWCGTNATTQLLYGPVTYPTQQSSSVTCPDGSPGPCAGAQWILPNWQSNVCNTSHATQTLWTPPDCGAPPGEYVVFKDANLKRCILSALPGQPSEITIQTAAKLLTVSCPGRGITDLTGLEKFGNLNSLDLTGNQITQFALNLPNLQSLKISDNALISLDVSGLSPSRQVRLEAANNQLTAVVGLSTAYLIMVDLSHNKLASFDLPQQAASLTYADLSYNNLTNVLNQVSQSLNGMSYLQYLDLSSNSIPTVGSVATIAGGGSPKLQSLFLACNPTFACSSLGLAGGANPATALPRSACVDYNAQDQQWIIRSAPFCPTEVQTRRSTGGRN